jgi:hypothetical protein
LRRAVVYQSVRGCSCFVIACAYYLDIDNGVSGLSSLICVLERIIRTHEPIQHFRSGIWPWIRYLRRGHCYPDHHRHGLLAKWHLDI